MVVCALLAASLVCHIEDPAPILPELPRILDQSWALRRGGSAKVDLSISLGAPVLYDSIAVYCDDVCQGEKHVLHSQCDDSCDVACSARHEGTIESTIVDQQAPFVNQDGPGNFGRGLEQFGHADEVVRIADVAYWSVGRDLGFFGEKGPYPPMDYPWKLRHWNRDPCSSTGKVFRRYAYEVKAKWSIYRFDTAPDGRQVKVQGPQGEDVMFKLLVPDRQALPGTNTIRCACSIVQEETRKVGFLPPSGTRVRGEVTETGVCLGEQDGAPTVSTGFLAQNQFQIECEDMVSATVSAVNSTDQDFTLVIHPGTVFVSQDDRVQDIGVVERIVLPVMAGMKASISVPVVRDPSELAVRRFEAKGRTLCLNMKRREPRIGDKFKVGAARDPVVRQLATFTAGLRIKGPTDQVRMWIVTDKANKDEIEKVLIPGPSAASYVRAMYEIAQNTALDLRHPDYRRVWVPDVGGGAAAGDEEFAWYVRNVERMDPRGLASSVKESIEAYARMLGPEGRSYEKDLPLTAARVLGASPSAEVRSAAVDLLLRAVPPSAREGFSAQGGLNGIGIWLTTNDAKAAEDALKVLEAYRTPEVAIFAANAGQGLPDPLRARASELAGIVGNPRER